MLKVTRTHSEGTNVDDVRALSEAVAERRLMLFYQPIVRMPTGQVVHYEALIRLRDREGHVIVPGRFLPDVSRLGLATEYTKWVIGTAISALKARPRLRIHVNLFSECVGNPSLLQFVREQVAGLAPGQFGFEMSEDTVIANMSATADWILALKQIGCQFAIDDFGAGNTATDVLVSLPVDCVKIDGSLVMGITADRQKRSLVEAVGTMARGQKKIVVAECVESEAIAGELISIGIEIGQGYFFGAPGPRLPQRMGRRRAVAAAGRAAT